jgi:hypothetical protein
VQFLDRSAQLPDLSMETVGGSIGVTSYDVSFDDFVTSCPSTAFTDSY